ncbi:MAG: DsrE family protein [Desulfurivibrionaceae bacterium]
MKRYRKSISRPGFILFLLAVSMYLLPAGVAAGGYDEALQGVKGVKAVFDVSHGSPGSVNGIFLVVKNVYEEETVRSLPEKPQVVVVFRGPAVKLLSTDRSGFKKAEYAELDKFHEMIRQMKKDGVTFEVCLYAAQALGVNPETILPEIDREDNGFISVIGYQAQGYGVVAIP